MDNTLVLVVTLVMLALTLVMLAHMAVFMAATSWHQKRQRVLQSGQGTTPLERLRDGLAKHDAMKAHPPWYVRYTNLFDRK